MVGKLSYLTCTRSYITYAVSVVNLLMHALLRSHLDAVQRIIKFQKGTLCKGIVFQKNTELKLDAYIDANWAGSIGRLLAGVPSQEGIQLCGEVINNLGLFALVQSRIQGYGLRDMGIALIEINAFRFEGSDNDVVHIDCNLIHRDQTKHLGVDRHFSRKNWTQDKFALYAFLSSKQFTNVLTKGSSGTIFHQIVDKLGLCTSLRGSVDKFDCNLCPFLALNLGDQGEGLQCFMVYLMEVNSCTFMQLCKTFLCILLEYFTEQESFGSSDCVSKF